MASARDNSRRQGQRLKAEMRAKRLLNLKRDGERLIPDKVLRTLASLNLPNNPWVYSVVLAALERESGK